MKNQIDSDIDKVLIYDYPARFWHQYKCYVENATKGKLELDEGDITYWREKLFTSFIIYFMPVCMIALVPGVFISLKEGKLVIAGFDLLIAAIIITVSLSVRINITFRKVFVIAMLYLVAIFFLIYLGLYGPGLVYLLSVSTFIALSFSRKVAYASILINLLICALCAFIISFKILNSALITECSLGAWIAISSNLIFLSIVSVILISHTISNLEEKIIKEFLLKNELKLVNDEKIRQNALLQESEMHYKSLFLQSPLPKWIMDIMTLQFLQVNEATLKTYGYTNEEFLSITLKELKLEKDLESDTDIQSFIDRVRMDLKIGTDASTTRITQHRRKNGDEFYTEIKFTSTMFKGIHAIIVVSRDLTEQINFTKAIEAQNAKLGEIAWIQSHVVRAPLARIMGLVDIIVRNNEESRDPELLNYLNQSANEFDEIIKTITMNTEQINLDSIVS